MQYETHVTTVGAGRAIVANGNTIAVCSPRFTLIKPEHMDREAERHGLTLVTRTFSRGGRKSFTQWAGSGDVAGYLPRLSVFDDHSGGAALRCDIGMLRLVCTNGMVARRSVHTGKRRHIGPADGGAAWLGDFFAEQVRLLKQEFDRAVYKVEALRQAPLLDSHTRILSPLGDGQLRKDVDLRANYYVRGGAPSPWGYIQGLTELAKGRQPAARMRLEMLAAELVDA